MKKELGKVIKILRNRKGMAQQTLADALQVDKGNVFKCESGKQNPTLDRLETLAHTLDTPLPHCNSRFATTPFLWKANARPQQRRRKNCAGILDTTTLPPRSTLI